jgi:putative ATP-dependent endonuclease of OLD family
MTDRSRLVKLRIENLGCVGPEGLEVALDDIVCLVGANNSGKSTVLAAYELAVGQKELKPEQYHNKGAGKPASVQLWVHIPAGAANVDAKWKEASGDLLLVRSKWEWAATGGKPTRTTWDPQSQTYSEDGKASGLDNVFNSRLPRPFRVGSLEAPDQEHKELLKLVLEPVVEHLKTLMKDVDSDLSKSIRAIRAEVEKPVEDFKEVLRQAETGVNSSYRRVFSSSAIKFNVTMGEIAIDPARSLAEASYVQVDEPGGEVKWSQQGTGSQRALFWSMLQVRSELRRLADRRTERKVRRSKLEADLKKAEKRRDESSKADTKAKHQEEADSVRAQLQALETEGDGGAVAEVFLPGYMLLIDEPETALHPTAVRAAKEHLYSLAAEAGWQVMLSTHHPAFVDPLKDHTTIVRLSRPEQHSPPNIYRSDSISFTPDERQNLKALLAFDSSVAEMFFGAPVLIVEGDTEFAAFTEILGSGAAEYPLDRWPLILRARGKATIPTLVKMLTHFKIGFSVLHDIDAPWSTGGARRNPAFSVNQAISEAVREARESGLLVIHRCSCPDFERQHSLALPSKDKPFECWSAVRASGDVQASVRAVLDELLSEAPEPTAMPEVDGSRYEQFVMAWAVANCPDEVEFRGLSTAALDGSKAEAPASGPGSSGGQ